MKRLPLWVSSDYNPNSLNTLINNEYHVTGLIGRELSSPLPFAGIGFGRTHTQLFDGLPADIRQTLKREVALVQDAVILGALLNCFFCEDGKVGFGLIMLKALRKFFNH